jgi:hypothetical protein
MPDDAVNFQAPLQLRHNLTLASPAFFCTVKSPDCSLGGGPRVAALAGPESGY